MESVDVEENDSSDPDHCYRIEENEAAEEETQHSTKRMKLA